ncbi:hypothetical protein [Jatrophihabitans sp.]|uniref:hypothetical protein n=1 Tax=Jatrophihabitans sp. TaxID=1932789 RepID=UPI002B61417B|nr:hypothetical protein [Jatrophihabitans sp.]
MRVALAALAVCLVLPVLVAPGDAVAAGDSAATAVGSPGAYQAVSRVRALDTRKTGAIPAKATAKVPVTGLGQVPATGVVAVSVNLTVLTPSGTGSVTAFADGTSWSGATMTFQAGQTDQNFETVPVTATGLIDIRNNTANSLNLIVDILGYYYPWGSPGRYQPMTPTRVLDTRTGQPVAAGQTRTFQVAGQGGIPPQGDFAHQVAVVANVTVLTPSRSGSLTVGETDLRVNTATMTFAAGQTEQGQLVNLLDDHGGLSVRNNSAAAVQLIADVVGYYVEVNVTDPGTYQHFNVGGHDRVYDSRATGQGPVAPGGTVTLPIQDLTFPDGGDSGICAPLLNVTMLSPSTGGSLSIWPDSVAWDGAATVTFVAQQTRQRMLMMKVGRNSGDVQVRNNSSAPITLIVDVDGWRTCV